MRPENYSLDRIDPSGNYEPGNLRWADAKTQVTNIRDPEGKSAKISALKTGMVNALNIEIQKVEIVPKELFHSRKDIYFTTRSKVYREWKTNKNV